jgi:hypothetical protein
VQNYQDQLLECIGFVSSAQEATSQHVIKEWIHGAVFGWWVSFLFSILFILTMMMGFIMKFGTFL